MPGKGTQMLMELQVLPTPPGTPEDHYRHVDAAIAAIERSGLTYEVGALGTTVEGTPEQLWPLAREVHEACMISGAEGVVTYVKVAESAGADPTIASLTAKFREPAG